MLNINSAVFIYLDIRFSFVYHIILILLITIIYINISITTLCVVTFASCVGGCVWFNSGVLVNNILLDVASRLWLKSLAVGGTLERREGREGKGTSELRWQIKVDSVHTKNDLTLQTSLMFYSIIALSTHYLLLQIPHVLSPSV